MQFSDILASLIHDMKNSLSLVINTLDTFSASVVDDKPDREGVRVLQQEARRLNNNLIELLTLYRIENGKISPTIEALNVGEFLSERVLENRAAAKAREVDLSWECDPELNGYFDEGLIRGVVNSLIGNGLRYTSSRLRLSAVQDEGYLIIRVDDDGQGFPGEMLAMQEAIGDNSRLAEGRTQLGIHFAGMVARLHRNRERAGYIRLTNGGLFNGGRFSIALP